MSANYYRQAFEAYQDLPLHSSLQVLHPLYALWSLCYQVQHFFKLTFQVIIVSSHLKSGFHKVSKLFLVDWHVVLGQPVTIEDWSYKSSIAIDVGKMLQSHVVDILICPLTLIIFNQPDKINSQQKLSSSFKNLQHLANSIAEGLSDCN